MLMSVFLSWVKHVLAIKSKQSKIKMEKETEGATGCSMADDTCLILSESGWLLHTAKKQCCQLFSEESSYWLS